MCKKSLFFLLFLLSTTLFASPELVYENRDKGFFQELFTKKTTYLSKNINFNLNLMSAYQLLSEEDNENTFVNTLHHKNPDKVLFTFSYKF